MKTSQKTTTTPVRVDNDLYKRVAEVAADNRRKVRAQLEVLLEDALARLSAKAQLETRKGASRGS